MPELQIRPLQDSDIPTVIEWARLEDFAPGIGDISIYKNTDRQGIWLGWLGITPIGCIAGVKYNKTYGFIGLYIVQRDVRGHGYGHQLWDTALDHLKDVSCIGLEAAPKLIETYRDYGFRTCTKTIRWQLLNEGKFSRRKDPSGLQAIGDNFLVETAASGAAELAPGGENGRGNVRQGMLESSNVNIVEELVEMIECQRAYEISSKMVSAVDEMLRNANQTL